MRIRSHAVVCYLTLAAGVVLIARAGGDPSTGWVADPAGGEPGSPNVVLPKDTPTFSEDVAPILFRHCAACHRPRGPGPFSVLSYEEVRPMASAIALATRQRRMPPWMPAPRRGDFADERRLTADDIRTIHAWLDAGAPRGDPRAMPPAPQFADGWYLGEPDLVVEMAEPDRIRPEDHEMFRHFVIPLPFTGDRWVEAVEVRPTDPSVVHHLDMMVDATSASRQMDRVDPNPGFDATHAMGTEAMPPGFFLGWTPGRVPARDGGGLAWPLDGSHDLVLQAHLWPRHQHAELSVSVGFHFADGPPERIPTIIKLTSETIEIPPGESHHLVTDSYVLPVHVELLGVSAHGHLLAREFQVLASVPGENRDRWLLHIPRWDFDWQDAYRYREPVALPAGTRLTMRVVYDNSEGNPRNPHRPPRGVRYGPRSTDEMGDAYLRVVPRDPVDLDALTSDLTLKLLRDRIAGLNLRLSLDPRDVSAFVELGDLYFSFGVFDRAALHYRWALEMEPDDAHALYHLGVTLLEEGKEEEAAGHFHRVTELFPEHAEAYHALAVVLVRLNRLEDAIDRYRRVVTLDPNHADAHRNLGVMLREMGEVDEGFAHFLQAAAAYVAAGEAAVAVHLATWIVEQAQGLGAEQVVREGRRLLERIRP